MSPWATDQAGRDAENKPYLAVLGDGSFLTTYPGDVSMAKKEEIEAFAKGGSARIQR